MLNLGERLSHFSKEDIHTTNKAHEEMFNIIIHQ